MQEELNQFVANDVWELVPQPKNMTIIGTKWVFRNKSDENGIVSRNKARLVAQGYNQKEGSDYNETYAPVARLESIRILLAYACALDFKQFQMDIKSAFLNGFMNEESVRLLEVKTKSTPWRTFQRSRDDKNGKNDRKCFRCGDPNHLIGECTKPPKDKNQRAFVRGSWSDRGEEDDEKAKNKTCLIAQASSEDGKVIGRGIRKKGLYVMKLGNKPKDQICLATIDENSMLWHRRLGHANMLLIQSLASKKLVRNLHKLKFDQHVCDACKIRKQAHASHKAKNIVSITRCLEFLHMDLFGPSAERSYEGNRYTLVIVDDYSSKAYIILNKHARKVKESLNVTFDETPSPSKKSPLVDDDLDEEEINKVTEKKNLELTLRMKL
nr:copia protein [Tanacetum cinerariifolium]